MRLINHSPSAFAEAISALLPPGAAWQWPSGGMGAALLLGTAEELSRVEAESSTVLATAIKAHRPKASSWNITEYRRVAREAVSTVTETFPRRTFAVGSRVGDRLWSHAAPGLTFPIDLVHVDHLLQPLRVGSRVGDRMYAPAGRYVMRVYYYRSVVDPQIVFEALDAFKQAHVYLHFIDVTGVGGEVDYGQN